MRNPEQVIAEKAADDPKFRAKVSEAIDLHDLQDHPGWIALKKHHENGKEGFGTELAAKIIRGEAANQRELDYMRGCYEMAETIFKYPAIALSNLERTARQLMEHEFEEEVAQHLLQSPYIDGEGSDE